MKTEYIVGIGEVLWDMLPEGRRLGGAPANFAYHVSQFGLNSMAVSAVGRDEAGDAVVRELSARAAQEGNTLKQPASVNASWDAPRDAPCESTSPGFRTMLSRVSFPTGTVGIRLDSSGVPQYDIRMPPPGTISHLPLNCSSLHPGHAPSASAPSPAAPLSPAAPSPTS